MNGHQCVLQGSVPGSVLFSMRINDLHAGVECTISKSVDNTKLREAIGYPEGQEALQRHIDRFT